MAGRLDHCNNQRFLLGNQNILDVPRSSRPEKQDEEIESRTMRFTVFLTRGGFGIR